MTVTGAGDSVPPPTLEFLTFHWGDAYKIGYGGDQWLAARRDHHAILVADTLAGLETAVTTDYRQRPVPRDFDPSTDAEHGDGHCPGDGAGFLLAALRAALPAWTITYSTEARAWNARTRKRAICENSPVPLCAALVLIEPWVRQATPGAGWSPDD